MMTDSHADLHMHTTASDGDFTPEELIKLANERGLKTIAITDHDTTDGIAPAQAAAAAFGMTVIPAVELSAETPEDGDVHVLGYYVNVADANFQEALAAFRENRYHRGRSIVRKLHELGIPLDWYKVAAIADGAPIARPHIARAMLAEGYVSELQEAFDKYLADDAPAHVARHRMSPEEAVDLIAGACRTEASGNVTLDTVHDIAATGVDAISSGALTHSVTALDVSMSMTLRAQS